MPISAGLGIGFKSQIGTEFGLEYIKFAHIRENRHAAVSLWTHSNAPFISGNRGILLHGRSALDVLLSVRPVPGNHRNRYHGLLATARTPVDGKRSPPDDRIEEHF